MNLPSEFFAGITALSLLGLVGGAVKYAWAQLNARFERRAAELDARETAFEEARDSRISMLEQQVAGLTAQLQELVDKVGRQRTAIHLLVAKIARDDPGAPELKLVEQLLGEEFPGFLRPPTRPALASEAEPG
ncbi:MAG TPA: hypothetical protein VEB68_03500 [Croceibacterium sp.]|nr:hypothetical protein [Croceibacterium sp.]